MANLSYDNIYRYKRNWHGTIFTDVENLPGGGRAIKYKTEKIHDEATIKKLEQMWAESGTPQGLVRYTQTKKEARAQNKDFYWVSRGHKGWFVYSIKAVGELNGVQVWLRYSHQRITNQESLSALREARAILAKAHGASTANLLSGGKKSSSQQAARSPKQVQITLDNLQGIDRIEHLLGPTEQEALRKIRKAQRLFKRRLLVLWGGCCSITEYGNQMLLIASHIKPWSKSSEEERTDKYNGLLLLPGLDILFDKGFISFDEKGCIKISRDLERNIRLFGIKRNMKLRLIHPEHKEYLRYHREKIFRK